MSCWIRKIVGEESTNHVLLAPDDWDLRRQVEVFESWLRESNGNLEPADRWVADIGFNVRVDASGGGPIISSELMQLCLDNRIEIYLSEYGLQDDA